MILMTLAAAALTQWTGPRTEEYRGPAISAAAGTRFASARGERALILPQGPGPAGDSARSCRAARSTF